MSLEWLMSHLSSTMPDFVVLDPDLSFTQMGLDSLLVASLELQLRQKFADLPFAFLDSHQTPRLCAAALDSLKSIVRLQYDHSIDFNREYPLSNAQQRFITASWLSEDQSNIFERFEVQIPDMNLKAIEDAWIAVSCRHSILRTSFSLSSQRISSHPVDINSQKNNSNALLNPIRVYADEKNSTIRFEYHHALLDASSIRLFINELWLGYRNLDEIHRKPNVRQFVEFCLFELETKDEQKWSEDEDFWRRELYDHNANQHHFFPSTKANGKPQYEVEEFEFDSKIFGKMKRLIRREGITLFSLFSTAVRILFYKLYDLTDFTHGFPFEDRKNVEFAETVGLFLNTTLCRVKLKSTKQSVLSFAHEVHRKTREALSHSTVPFDRLIQKLRADGIETRGLMDVFLVDDQTRKEDSGLTTRTLSTSIHHPQTWYFNHDDSTLKVVIEYDQKRFQQNKIVGQLKQFEKICYLLVEKLREPINSIQLVVLPDIPLIKSEASVLSTIMNKLREMPPNQVVMIKENSTISASKLLKKIRNVNTNLRKVRPEAKFVALLLPRTFDLIACVLGGWLSGRAIVPMSREWSKKTQQEALDALFKPSILITDEETEEADGIQIISLHDVLKGNEDLYPNITVESTNLSYATFTSGSTGTPKLVLSDWCGLDNLLFNYTREFGFDSNSVVYQVVNSAFDIFLADLVVTFANGGCLILAKFSIPNLKEIEDNQVTHAYVMPAYLARLNTKEEMRILSNLKVLMFGGERVSWQFVSRALESGVRLVQLFGFTEHSIYTNYQWITEVEQCKFIGQPFTGTRLMVVDRDGHERVNGFEGHLVSVGVGLSRGYAAQTEEIEPIDNWTSFSILPSGARGFRSGDVGRREVEGLRFLGRKDDQVKVRGNRVYLHVVEYALMSLSAIRQAVAMIDPKTNELVVFLVRTKEVTEGDVKNQLRNKLTDYSTPKRCYFVSEVPLNLNGKVDRQQIMQMLINEKQELRSIVSKNAQTKFENLEIFRRFLNPNYNLDDDLFVFGADSLILLQIAQEFHSNGIELNVHRAFESRTAFKWLETATQTKPFIHQLSNGSIQLDIGPATYNQEHVWLHRDLHPEHSEDYWVRVNLRFKEPIHKERLINALKRIVKENSSLRTKVEMNETDGLIQQVVYPFESQPFDLPFRWKIERDRTVHFSVDHSTVDGHSLRLVVSALADYYRDPKSESKFPMFSSIDYAQKEREQNFKVEIEYFRQQLKSIGAGDPQVRSTDSIAAYEKREVTIPSSLLKGCQFTLFQVTLAAFVSQLVKQKNNSVVVVGISFANRRPSNSNFVGYFANTLPISFKVPSNQTINELLVEVQNKVVEASKHSSLPFALLARVLKPKRQVGVNPFFNRLFSFEDFAVNEVDDVFEVENIPTKHAILDETWTIRRKDDNIRIEVEYSTEKFSNSSIRESLDQFEWKLNDISKFIKSHKRSENELVATNDHQEPTQQEVAVQILRFVSEELKLKENNQQLSINSNFFDLGAHSLTAARLSAQIRRELSLDCSTRDVFAKQTANELAAFLLRDRYPTASVSYLQEPILRFMSKNKDTTFRQQYEHHFTMETKLTRKELTVRLRELVDRCEALRTQFCLTENGEFKAQISETPVKFELPFVVQSPDFALETVYINCQSNGLLEFKLSHLTVDGPSMKIMSNWLRNDKRDDKTETTTQFAVEFNQQCDEQKEKVQRLWQKILEKPNGQLYRDHHSMTFESSELRQTIPRSSILEKMKNERVSSTAVLLHLLGRSLSFWLTTKSELFVGIAKDMRGDRWSNTVGFFTQTLPVPVLNRSIQQLEELLHDVYEHSTVRFDSLLTQSKSSSLFDVMLSIETDGNPMDVKIRDVGEVKGKFPLTFHVSIRRTEVDIQVVYWRDWWSEETVKSMLYTFVYFLDPNRLLPLIQTISTSEIDVPFIDPIDQMYFIAEKAPDRPAIQTPKIEISYGQLSQKIKQIAAILQQKSKIKEADEMFDSIILVSCDRSVRSIVLCLSVMASGSAYLPIDSENNSLQRLERIVEELKPQLVISESNELNLTNWISIEELWTLETRQLLISNEKSTKHNLAYVIYTSGSTGNPKGVQIERCSLVNTINDAKRFFDVQPMDCIFQFTNLSFDNSVLEIFLALNSEARLFVDDSTKSFCSRRFGNQIEEFGITHAFLFPGIVSTFNDSELKQMAKLKLWISGAEKLDFRILHRAHAAGIRVAQNYGPTECTCYALRRFMTSDDHPQCIGSPVSGCRVRIDEEELGVPPMSAPRELLIAGRGLMRGYVGDDEEKPFVVIENERFYRTGDLCRWTSNGEVLFVGREDSVVKVRGFRVDLSEVEAAVMKYDQIEQTRVLVDSESITAFVVSSTEIDSNKLREHCRKFLPRFAVPNVIRQIVKMPLTENTKIDANRLRSLTPIELTVEKTSEIEKLLGDLWSRMFGRSVGLDESFFELGGHSLTAQRMLNELEDYVGRDRVSIADLMKFPTIREFASIIKKSENLFEEQKPTSLATAPLSFQQESFLFLEETSAQPGAYNLQFLRFHDKLLDEKKLKSALIKMAERHPILRTQLKHQNDHVVQLISGQVSVTLEVEEMSEFELRKLLQEDAEKPFDLFARPPIAVRLIKLDDCCCLYVRMHHLLSDATTTQLIDQQLTEIYDEKEEEIGETLSYAQWSAEQREESRVQQFRKKIKDMASRLRPILEESFDLNAIFNFDEATSVHVQTFCCNLRAAKFTPFAQVSTYLALAIVEVFETRQPIVIGAPTQNRCSRTIRTFGNFLNNLLIPLIVDSNATLDKNMVRVSEAIANSIIYSEVPFVFIADEFRDLRLFDVYVNCRYNLEAEGPNQVFDVTEWLPSTCHFPLELDIDNTNKKDVYRITWRTRIRDEQMNRLFECFCQKLNRIRKKDLNARLPVSTTKEKVRSVFSNVLNASNIDFDDSTDFFQLGGNSLAFLRLRNALQRELDCKLDAPKLLTDCSVSGVCRQICSTAHSTVRFHHRGSTANTIVFLPSLVGGLLGYRHLIRSLVNSSDCPTLIGIELPNRRSISIKEIADEQSMAMKLFFENEFVDSTSVYFVGASFGAILAYEVAQRTDFRSKAVISIDGIANSAEVNTTVTFNEHRDQLQPILDSMVVDEQTQSKVVNESWHLLQLSIQHKPDFESVANFDRLVLLSTNRSQDYGWYSKATMRIVHIESDHWTMLNKEKAPKVAFHITSEIRRSI